VDSDLRVTYLNGCAASLVVDHVSMLGTLLLESVTGDAASVLRPPLERAVETGTAQSCEWMNERIFGQGERGMSGGGTGIGLSHPDARQAVRR